MIFLRFLPRSGFRIRQTALFGAVFRYNTPRNEKIAHPSAPPRRSTIPARRRLLETLAVSDLAEQGGGGRRQRTPQ